MSGRLTQISYILYLLNVNLILTKPLSLFGTIVRVLWLGSAWVQASTIFAFLLLLESCTSFEWFDGYCVFSNNSLLQKHFRCFIPCNIWFPWFQVLFWPLDISFILWTLAAFRLICKLTYKISIILIQSFFSIRYCNRLSGG